MRRGLLDGAVVFGLLLVTFVISQSAPGAASAPSLRSSWTLLERGARGGELWGGPSAGMIDAVYLPASANSHGPLRVVYLLDPRATPPLLRELQIAHIADQLAWQGTTVPFAVVVIPSRTSAALATAIRYAQARLPLQRSRDGSLVLTIGARRTLGLRLDGELTRSLGSFLALGLSPSSLPAVAQRASAARMRAVLALQRSGRSLVTARGRGSGPPVSLVQTRWSGRDGPALWHRQLFSVFTRALAPPAALRASAAAADLLPSSFTRIAVGPAGGTVWQGVIPGAPWRHGPRPSLVYLPPGIDRSLRYPVVYLLHGIRGAPYSFLGGLQLTLIADHLISTKRARPFIAVMAPAGDDAAYRGEWTGVWETYLVRSVLPYVDHALPTIARAQGRVIAGLSAGGYGALDISLRHPGEFGTVEAWSGYFRAPNDGSLAHASTAQLAAHDPSLLIPAQAAALRSAKVRFYLTSGAQDHEALAQTRRFARLLTSLGLRATLVITSGGHTTSSWRAGLPAALTFAIGR